MTRKQQNKLMIELWPAACRAQGWKVSDRTLRLAKLSEILGRSIESASEINETTDFDAVKRTLGMWADNLTATIEMDQPELGAGRRWLKLIAGARAELGHYVTDADAYVASLLYDGYQVSCVEDLSAVVTPARTPGKKDTSQLQRFYFTLNARVKALKKEAENGQVLSSQNVSSDADDSGLEVAAPQGEDEPW